MSGNVWVLAGAGMPCGARVAAPYDNGERVWLDVCILGQHLPQLYLKKELHPLDHKNAAELGLCDRCLGFGTRETFSDLYPRNMTQIPGACEHCGGTGRPKIRVEVHETEHEITGRVTVLPHAYEPGGQRNGCLHCGEMTDYVQHTEGEG
jgi:hypothetical protein